MTLVAMISGRSPGLTTTAHTLSTVWPARRQAVVAELDPDGGSLGARHELPCEPGLTTLAAAGRRGLVPDAVLQHCRRLPDGTVALLGPVAPDRAASALSVLGSRLALALDALPGIDVLADCGRIDSRSPALDVVRAARYVVVVVTPSLEGVAHVHARMEALALAPGRVGAVTIGTDPYRPGEVGAALGLPVLGTLARDRRGADDLAAGRVAPRSELIRTARSLAERVAGLLSPVVPEPVAPEVSGRAGRPSPASGQPSPADGGDAPSWSPPADAPTAEPLAAGAGPASAPATPGAAPWS